MAGGADGYSFFGELVVGIDEAGRGPLAGPVVAAGVMLDDKRPITGLNDSKKLSEKNRELLYSEIMDKALIVSVSEIDVEAIDRLNILRATLAAMGKVIHDCMARTKIDAILIDGHQTVAGIPIKQIAVVKGDTLIECIMAASIVAKVHRDRLMRVLENVHPGYGFAKHKGYGTRDHLDALSRLGPSPIHRKSFAPCRESP